ncbi:MAG: hypothetical protein K2I37_02725 [Muribaculaceae bacterium]|nr:hypothetical protein [Muribaculaceae bacterium]
MKRFYLSLLALAAIITHGYAYKAIDLSIGAIVDEETVPVTVPQRDVDVAEDGSVTVTYQFSKISLVDDSKNLDNVILSIDGFGQNSIVGEFIWPLRVDRILLPQGANAKLLVLDESYSEYDMTLANVQHPLRSDVNPAPVTVMESIVSSEGFYPDSSVKDVGISVYRGEASLKVQVNPVQYDMLAHKVRIYDRISYRVSFDDTEAEPNVLSECMAVEAEIPMLEENDEEMPSLLYNSALNAPLTSSPNAIVIPGGGQVSIAGFKEVSYLIIADSTTKDYANKLAKWKTLMGFTVKVIQLPTKDSGAIYNIIKSHYTSMTNLQYVLLFGSELNIPPYTETSLGDTYLTDYHYGCMDDSKNDFEQDICIGRINARSAMEASTAVDKIINYDKYPITDPYYYKNSVHCAEFESRDGLHESGRFVKTSQEIYEYMLYNGKSPKRLFYTSSKVKPTYWNNSSYSYGERIPADLQRPNYSWIVNSTDIDDVLYDGAWYLLYNGHGDIDGWHRRTETDSVYTRYNITNLAKKALPICFSFGCSNGDFRSGMKSPHCFASALLMQSASCGANGVIAASATSYSPYNEVLATGLFDAMFPSPGLEPMFPSIQHTNNVTVSKPVYSLGEILQHAMMRLDERFSANDAYVKKLKQIYHIFGDPSMKIRTEYLGPIKVTVERPALQTKPGFTLNLTQAPEGTIVTIYDEETGKVTHNSMKTLTYQTDHPESVTVVIHAHNYGTIVKSAEYYAMDPLPPISPIFPVGITNVQKTGADMSVSYELPENCSAAKLVITSPNGLSVKEEVIDVVNQKGNIVISSESKGVYGLTLIVDGEPIDARNVAM